MVIKHTSSVSAPAKSIARVISHEFANYVDDTGKSTLDRSNLYFAAREVRDNPPPPSGPSDQKVIVPGNYARGQIHLEGFLAVRARAAGITPDAPPNLTDRRAWVDRVADIWREEVVGVVDPVRALYSRRAAMVPTAVKFILSPAPSDTRKLTDAGQSIVVVMNATVRNFWACYERQHGLPPGSIGYAWGIHLDKDHVHAHCVALPKTSSGEPLRLSNRMVVRGEPERRNFRDEFFAEVRRYHALQRDLLLEASPGISLVDQLHRALGARAVVGTAPNRQTPLHQLQDSVIALAHEDWRVDPRFATLTARDLGPVLKRWAGEGVRKAPDPTQIVRNSPVELDEVERPWWRWLWIALEWRKRKRSGPEAGWTEVPLIAKAIEEGRVTGPKREVIPALLRKVAQEERNHLSIVQRPDEPLWARAGRVKVNELLALSREVLLRALAVDALSTRSAAEPFLRTCFNREALGLATAGVTPSPAAFSMIDRPVPSAELSTHDLDPAMRG